MLVVQFHKVGERLDHRLLLRLARLGLPRWTVHGAQVVVAVRLHVDQ